LAKILFITSRFPYPLNKGDKLRVYYQLKYLAPGNDVHLVAIEEKAICQEEMDAVAPFCKSILIFVLPLYKRLFQLVLSPFKQFPLQVAFFYNSSIQKKIKKVVNEIKPDYIHCHLIRTTEYIKDIQHIPKSLDFMDAFGAGMEKREKAEKNWLKKLLFSYEKKQLYAYENKTFGFIDSFSIISMQDQKLIQSPRANEIKIIPNGVDFERFYPRNTDKRYDILFMGNLSYPPNIEAVLFLANEIMPLVKQMMPSIKLLIAGIDPPKRIQQLQSANIDVIEKFDDISESIAISRIMLAPMQISIGLQNKILQAMAMKTPCIVSTLSNNAIHAPNHKAVVEANAPEEFADSIIALLTDEKKAVAIGQAGYDFVKEQYTWIKQNQLLVNLITNKNC
jgi:glycosyltransferase involved in cell wall biosynthesis